MENKSKRFWKIPVNSRVWFEAEKTEKVFCIIMPAIEKFLESHGLTRKILPDIYPPLTPEEFFRKNKEITPPKLE